MLDEQALQRPSRAHVKFDALPRQMSESCGFFRLMAQIRAKQKEKI